MTTREHHQLSFVAALGMTVSLVAAAQEPGSAIDTGRSSLTIHVDKAGLLSAAGHEHWVNAPIENGAVDSAGANPSVRLSIDAGRLAVKPDKGLSGKDQAEVQTIMQNKVLESSKYPQIVFQSTQVRRAGDRAWKVSGDLTLHGATRPVTFDVAQDNDAYVGKVRIKQTDFGIQPIRVGGGVVKVKDELEIQFRVYTAPR
jgi:polyisoprenoid-binding protein YceI